MYNNFIRMLSEAQKTDIHITSLILDIEKILGKGIPKTARDTIKKLEEVREMIFAYQYGKA